jgi:hypothetical protein
LGGAVVVDVGAVVVCVWTTVVVWVGAATVVVSTGAVTVVVFAGAVTVFVWVTVSAFGGLVVAFVAAAAVAVVGEVLAAAVLASLSDRLPSPSPLVVDDAALGAVLDDVALGAVLDDVCVWTLLTVWLRSLATVDAPPPQPASASAATVATNTPERCRPIMRRGDCVISRGVASSTRDDQASPTSAHHTGQISAGVLLAKHRSHLRRDLEVLA